VFLDPDMRTTVRAIIATMRQWRVVPNAMLFDNAAPFKGRLLVAFCKNVGIRLIHAAEASRRPDDSTHPPIQTLSKFRFA
jgi:hypothetical protein